MSDPRARFSTPTAPPPRAPSPTHVLLVAPPRAGLHALLSALQGDGRIVDTATPGTLTAAVETSARCRSR